jgi:hypothetical protein
MLQSREAPQGAKQDGAGGRSRTCKMTGFKPAAYTVPPRRQSGAPGGIRTCMAEGNRGWCAEQEVAERRGDAHKLPRHSSSMVAMKLAGSAQNSRIRR